MKSELENGAGLTFLVPSRVASLLGQESPSGCRMDFLLPKPVL